jgi:hypothetical protein
MKFLFTNQKINLDLCKDFENIKHHFINNSSLLINDENTLTKTDNLLSITNGYLRDTSKNIKSAQEKSAAEYVFHNWPVSDNITGSFSSFIYDKNNSEIVVTSDHCNVYPLYYLNHDKVFYFSNSLILLGRYSGADLDKTGIFQRAVGPDFCNIGSRTILKNVKRLLPGEWIKFEANGKIKERRFDNSLYQNIKSGKVTKKDIQVYWEHYKKETALCGLDYDNVNIALSGGIDSRLALGSIVNKKISAYTYGSPENYESKVAQKLAKLKNANHQIFFDYGQYFPLKKTLYAYSRNTEAINLNSWLEILKKIQPKEKEPIFFGELCEALPGRNIKKLNTGEFRKQKFFQYYVKGAEVQFNSSTHFNFQNWKKKKIKFLTSWYVDFWFKKLNFSDYKEKIITETINDSEEIFNRIEDHHLPYEELFDELFSWYTYTRMTLSRQVNICNEKFYAFSPGMSLQMLKKTSNIHPNNRLYYRFANKLLKEVPELKIFGMTPTSQIPYIPQKFPNFIKVPIWAIRSKIDDWLIKKMMQNRNINMRYRLFPSLNWAYVYQNEDMEDNLKGYYENNHLAPEYFEIFLNLARERKELKKWPFANMDIMSGAALNTELDLIKNYPK